MDVVQDGKRSLPKGAHVRFSHVEVDGAAQAANAAGSNPTLRKIQCLSGWKFTKLLKENS